MRPFLGESMFKWSALAAFLVAATGSSALAASVSVKPGDDLSVLTQSLGPGDIVSFGDGVYELTGTLRVSAEGAEGNPIQLRGLAGATPTLRTSGGGNVFELNDSSYVEVTGLIFEGHAGFEESRPSGVRINNSANIIFRGNTIRQVWGTALRVDGNTSRLTIERNLIDGTGEGSGIYTGCNDGSCWMQDSKIHNNLIRGLKSDNRYGVYLSSGAQNNEVTDNVLVDLEDRGIYADSTQLGAPNLIERNLLWGLGDHAILIYGAARVRNNVIIDVNGYGIFSNTNNNNGLEDVVISYNTVADTVRYGIRVESWWDRPGMVISSNVVANPLSEAFFYQMPPEGELPQTYVTSNVFTGLVTAPDREVLGGYIPGSGFSDFVDIDMPDLYPGQLSALVNAGDPSSGAWVPAVDFNGAPRDGTSPDIGAYEWSGAANPGWALAPDFKDFDLDAVDPTFELSSGCCGSDGDAAGVVWLPLLGLGALARRRRRTVGSDTVRA